MEILPIDLFVCFTGYDLTLWIWFDSLDVCLYYYSAAFYSLVKSCLVDSSVSSVSAATCTSYNIFLLGSNAASVSAMFTSYIIFLVDSSANSA